MGELKPCPFCGNDAWIIEDRGAGGHERLLFRPQCKACGADLGGHDFRDHAITAWNTRPRTEGRGEESSITWMIVYPGCETGPIESLHSVALAKAMKGPPGTAVVGLVPVSPIREPEISREAVDAMIAHHDACAQEASEDMGAFVQEGGGMPPEQMRERLRFHQAAVEQLHAILNLAPVGWRPIETAPSSEAVLVFIPMADNPAKLPVGTNLVAYQTAPAPPLKQTWRHAVGPGRGTQCGWPTHWQPLPPPPQEQGGMK